MFSAMLMVAVTSTVDLPDCHRRGRGCSAPAPVCVPYYPVVIECLPPAPPIPPGPPPTPPGEQLTAEEKKLFDDTLAALGALKSPELKTAADKLIAEIQEVLKADVTEQKKWIALYNEDPGDEQLKKAEEIGKKLKGEALQEFGNVWKEGTTANNPTLHYFLRLLDKEEGRLPRRAPFIVVLPRPEPAAEPTTPVILPRPRPRAAAVPTLPPVAVRSGYIDRAFLAMRRALTAPDQPVAAR